MLSPGYSFRNVMFMLAPLKVEIPSPSTTVINSVRKADPY